ncbi:MAG: hypothetical protein DLM69_10015 [Candidatus Chloroheliales bacterium]|nr:MAG: hypothetical protein DLM69_10015 [Chloroflexota bacterium]
MADYTITLNLNDEQRSVLDEARGNTDIADYILNAAVKVAQRKSTRRDRLMSVAELTPDLTPEDHMSLVEAARQPGRTLTLEEVRVKLDNLFVQARAKAAREDE